MDVNGYYNEREALRYFGAPQGDARAAAVLGAVYFKLRNEFAPRFHAVRVGCVVSLPGGGDALMRVQEGEGRQVQGAKVAAKRHVPAGRVTFTGPVVDVETQAETGGPVLGVVESTYLARHLQGCTEALLFAATLGARLDIAMRRLTLQQVTEGAAAQAVAASVMEEYCDDMCRQLQQRVGAGLILCSRFSPGYGDWDLGAGQRWLFPVLDCGRQIGLTLTAAGMMAPTKSVTAVIGLGACEPGRRGAYEATSAQAVHDCNNCALTHCAFRH